MRNNFYQSLRSWRAEKMLYAILGQKRPPYYLSSSCLAGASIRRDDFSRYITAEEFIIEG